MQRQHTALLKNKYSYNIKKFYKIWFSKDPDIFLGLENELRLIAMRENHKDAAIYFIYSSKTLNQEAQTRLKKFCDHNRIMPVDFDTTLLESLETEKDKKIYSFAKKEIENTCNEKYGNLAAASDCVRILTTVVRRFGIYSDFDVMFNLGQIDAAVVQLDAPVLLNIHLLDFDACYMPDANSDFLAFSVDTNNSELLSSEALKALDNLQNRAINNYSENFSLNTLMPFSKSEFPPYDLFSNIFKEITQGKSVDVYTFRKLCANYFEAHPDKIEAFRYLTLAIVMGMAGPYIYGSLYENLTPNQSRQPVFISKNDTRWQQYLQLLLSSSVDNHPLLSRCIKLTNQFNYTGKKSDESWTAKGMLDKRARETKMVSAGQKIFCIWRKPTSAHVMLLLSAKKICNQEQLGLIKQKQYSLLLRRACSNLNLTLVQLLLKFKDRIKLKINETSTNGKTALDWVMTSTAKPDHQREEICKILKEAGAESNIRPEIANLKQ